MLKKMGFAVLLIALSGAASAKETCTIEHFLWFTYPVCTPVVKQPGSPVTAPEIDPASAMAALTLVAGGLAVIRSRRSKKLAV